MEHYKDHPAAPLFDRVWRYQPTPESNMMVSAPVTLIDKLRASVGQRLPRTMPEATQVAFLDTIAAYITTNFGGGGGGGGGSGNGGAGR